MKQIENEIHPPIRRALEVCVQIMGIQRSAANILAVLYSKRNQAQNQLSSREISERTGLSISSVSVLCSQLESMGILARNSDGSGTTRGRRRGLYALEVGIEDMLSFGIRKQIQDVRRVYRELRVHSKSMRPSSEIDNKILDRAEVEVASFLSEHAQWIREDNQPIVVRNRRIKHNDLKESSLEHG